MKILIAVTLLMIFSMSLASAVETADNNTAVNQTTEPIMACQNSPPPSYCSNGDILVRTGTDANGCPSWGCNKPTCVAIADCAPGYAPGESYIDANGCRANKCLPVTDCVKEGDSYPVATTPNSGPEKHCCAGLIPYAPVGFTGGAKCVKQPPQPTCPEECTCNGEVRVCPVPGNKTLPPVPACPSNCVCEGEVQRCTIQDNTTKTCPSNCECTGEMMVCHIQDNKTGKNCPLAAVPNCEAQGLKEIKGYNADGCEIISCEKIDCTTVMPPSPEFIASCDQGIQKQLKDGCVIGYACISSTNPPIPACVSDEHIQDMNALLKSLKDAEQNNDPAQADAIKAKIQDLQIVIQSDKKDCGASPNTTINPAQASTTNPPTKVIVEYYKAKISDISSVNDSNTQLLELKSLRADIDRMINDLVNNNSEINTTQMAPLVQRFYITSQSGSADGVQIPVSGKTFVARADNTPYTINPTSEGVTIISAGVSAEASNITIDNETLKVGNSIVKIMPGEAVSKYNIAPKDMRLVESGNGPIYNIVSVEKRKIIGVFSTDITTNTVIDATSGDKIKESKPWWTFITSPVYGPDYGASKQAGGQ